MEQIQAILKNFIGRWIDLSFNQKVLVGTLLMAITMASVFLMYQAQEDYDVLYSNISLPDAAAVVAKLKEQKSPYKLLDGGTTILVPRKHKSELILETAADLSGEQTVNLAKIPPIVQGDVEREWIRKVNTDAIAETLRSIQGIKQARVIISQPEETIFSDNEKPATASVMLMVEPGFRLRDEQVKTIRNLVSHAVPGLTAENVAIADNLGNALDGNPGGGGSSTTNLEDKRKKFEEETRKKILEILAPLVGKENAVVSVSADLNFDQSQAKIHRVIPLGGSEDAPTGLVVSNQESTEEYNGTKANTPGGEPGSNSNTPSYQASGGNDANKKPGDYKLLKKTTNFAHSEEEKTVLYAAGQVERMTIAVVLNKVLTSKEIEELKQSVANAAGVDLNRGDSVDVKGFQFSQAPNADEKQLAQALKSSQDQEMWVQMAYIGAMVVLGLTALILFFILFKKPAEGQIIDAYEEEEPQYTYIEPIMPEPEQIPVRETPVIEAKLEPEVELIRDAINNVVLKDPSQAARLLTSFIKEG